MPETRNGTPPNASVGTALAKTISALPREAQDAGLIQLARRYADAIDAQVKEYGAADSWGILEKLGPKLLACLEQLGATPMARKSAPTTKGVTTDAAQPVRSSMDELRARRTARVNGA